MQSPSCEDTVVGNQDGRRRFVRIPIRIEVEYRDESFAFSGQISDLGEGGAFLDTPNPLPVGTDLKCKFYLPDDPKPIEGKARVVWQQLAVGMGVEFEGLSREDRKRIKFFVASKRAGDPGRPG